MIVEGLRRSKFTEPKRSLESAYLFHHLEPGGVEADWETFDSVVEAFIKDFQRHQDTPQQRWNVVCEFLALVLSTEWSAVE